jgi:hypothetical protein
LRQQGGAEGNEVAAGCEQIRHCLEG